MIPPGWLRRMRSSSRLIMMEMGLRVSSASVVRGWLRSEGNAKSRRKLQEYPAGQAHDGGDQVQAAKACRTVDRHRRSESPLMQGRSCPGGSRTILSAFLLLVYPISFLPLFSSPLLPLNDRRWFCSLSTNATGVKGTNPLHHACRDGGSAVGCRGGRRRAGMAR